MTRFTGAIALFALCSFVVGILQWNAMRGQLDEMKNSSADTRELARAASRQATASEEANRNALNAERPWIGVMMAVDSFEVDRTPTITLAYFNTGRRPAKVTLTEYRWATYAVFPENPEYPEPGTAKSTNIVVPGARSDVTITVDKLTESQMSVWKSRSRSFYIHTNIEYEDPVTNARHWTHACWQYIWFEKGVRSGFYNCPKYNEAK